MVFDALAGVCCDTDVVVEGEAVGRHLGSGLRESRSGVARHDWGESRLDEEVRLDWDWMSSPMKNGCPS